MNINEIYDGYGDSALKAKIEEIIDKKCNDQVWDRGTEGGSTKLLSLLMYEYATSIETLTKGGIKASVIVDKFAERMGRFRFGDFKSMDDCVSYDRDKVTSYEYQMKCRIKEHFGAHTISYQEGEKEAVVIFDQTQKLKKDNEENALSGINLQDLRDIRGTVFHEWTHVMEKSLIQTSDLRVEDIIHQEGDSTYINASVDVNMSMQEFQEYIKRENVDALLTKNKSIAFSGLSTVEINTKKSPNNRIMHNQISEGATEFIARLIVAQVGERVIDATRYEQQVGIIKRIFESRGLAETLTTYFTQPQKIVTELESLKVKDTDMLHYLSDYVDFLPRVKEGVVGDLIKHNELKEEDCEMIFKSMQMQLGAFLQGEHSSIEQEQMASDLISRFQINSEQAQKLIKQAVRYRDMKNEVDQVMDRSFGKSNQSKTAYFHDQKSENFFEGMSSGRYSLGFTEQEIGKATVYTTIEQKREAEKVGESDIRDVEQSYDLTEK